MRSLCLLTLALQRASRCAASSRSRCACLLRHCCQLLQSLNFFFAGNALALASAALSACSVESVIHQQGHFVVRLNPSSQLPIELFIHGQRFGMQCVHGFFGLNAFLSLPIQVSGRRTSSFSASRRSRTTRRLSSLLWRSLLSDQVFTCVVDVGFRARDLVSHGCDSVTAFFGGHVRHQAASLFFDRFDKRVELVVIGENRHRVLSR
jgi:hypothetical protein